MKSCDLIESQPCQVYFFSVLGGKLAVVGRQKRQTTSGYNPSDYGWLEVAYSPTELDNLPPGLLGKFN